MKILGIDPGTATTGFAIIETDGRSLKLLDYGAITTPKGLKNYTRLNQIADDIETLVKKWKPQKASIEKLFFNKNIKTAISVAEARGVISQHLAKNNIAISEFGPSEIKCAICGNGQADKKAVQKMVQLLMRLEKIPRPDDAADAIAVAICCANTADFASQAMPTAKATQCTTAII